MDRRKFMYISSILALSSINLNAKHNNMEHMGNKEHNMHMEHDKHSMDNMKGSDVYPKNLLSKNLLPKNNDLKELSVLKNESSKKGEFIGTIEISKTKMQFAPGLDTEVYAYNGMIPGPLIELNEGDKVKIKVKNKLNEVTTIHWHGLVIPFIADGAPLNPIAANEEKIYEFKVKKGSAGTYWYHPHGHETTSMQVAKGLAGPIIIKTQDELSHLSEKHLFISDIRLDKNGIIPPNTMSDWMDGREGNIVLINGQYQPKIQLDKQTRIRIWNCCSARYLQLAIQDVKMILVGSDGGLIESPLETDKILITPAQRVEVILNAEKSGTYTLKSIYYDRKKMMSKNEEGELILASIILNKDNVPLPKKLNSIREFNNISDKKIVAFQELEMDMKNMKKNLKSLFLINNKTFDMNRVDFKSKLGSTEEWIIKNESDMDHPFHMHGVQFEVINSSIFGKPKVRMLRDTVNTVPEEIVTIRLKHEYKGLWMLHCHILEHEHLGMMAILKVV